MIKLRTITPARDPFDVAALRRARTAALDKTARWIKQQQEKTTATWGDKPEFSIDSPSESERVVGTDDQKYQWADEGTEPHTIPPIVPKGKKAITILGPGRAKTRPRVIGSSGGSKGGVVAIVRSTKPIQHPGTAAREFSEIIGEEAETELARNMQRAIDGVG